MKSKKKIGHRPTEYKKKYDEQAYKYCLLGASDKQLGNMFNVSEQTINSWKQKFPSFLESLNKGKEIADAEVSKQLFHRAKGYKHTSEKIFMNKYGEIVRAKTIEQYAPDTTACIFWLKNRQSKAWRDKTEVEVENTDVKILDDDIIEKIKKEYGSV